MTQRWEGSRFVTVLYVLLVALSGVFGAVIGIIRPKDLDPDLFFLVDLPATPMGMALYGMATVGVLLGALLLVVNYVGDRYDTETPR